MIMPKCTGSTPIAFTTGSMIGVQIRIIGAMSMKVPSSSRRMLISINITYLFSVKLRKSCVAFAGNCMIAIR